MGDGDASYGAKPLTLQRFAPTLQGFVILGKFEPLRRTNVRSIGLSFRNKREHRLRTYACRFPNVGILINCQEP